MFQSFKTNRELLMSLVIYSASVFYFQVLLQTSGDFKKLNTPRSSTGYSVVNHHVNKILPGEEEVVMDVLNKVG